VLPPAEKQELLLFLVARLRATGDTPSPRKFSREQMNEWITQDDAQMQHIRNNNGK